jgi:MFS family permease
MEQDRRALPVLLVAMLLASLDSGVAGVALPGVAAAFAASFAQARWIVVANLAAAAAASVWAGRSGDRFGRRRLLLAGMGAWTAGALGSGLAPSLSWLIAARFFQGVAAAFTMALSTALVADILPKERVGRGLGLLGAASAAGTALGPSLGGALTAWSGWRAVFLAGAPLGLLALLSAAWTLPADKGAAPGGTRGGRASAELLREPGMALALLSNALVMTVLMGAMVVGPFHLSEGLGLSPAWAGLILSAGPVTAALAGYPSGRLTDRLGSGPAAIAGLAVSGAACLLLALLPVSLGAAGFAGPLMLLTGGYALFQTANGAAVIGKAGPEGRGAAAGLLNLSRSLGRMSGAWAMGALFAAAAGSDPTSAATAAATRWTFAAAAALVAGAAVLSAWGSRMNTNVVFRAALAAGLLSAAHAAAAERALPAPDGPYPLEASGWGPRAADGRWFSRWVEDWTALKASGKAAPLKAMPLGGGASVTLSAEARLRHESRRSAELVRGDGLEQPLARGVVGADMRAGRMFRAYGELATGWVGARRAQASARSQNEAAVQQAFVEARRGAGGTLWGVMAGRQEFADGPRQLVALNEGPNLRRSWSGARVYAHAAGARLGAFAFTAVRPERGVFDERVAGAERLSGVNASIIVSDEDSNVYLDPFSLHSVAPAFRAGGRTGRDERVTHGARLWGRRGPWTFDWTAAGQTGAFMDRSVGAWALFAGQSLDLSGAWSPRLTARVDVASGGGVYGPGGVRGFNPLYGGSNYIGEGRFLAPSNLLLVTPGLSFAPDARSRFSVEYGYARRLAQDDAAYAGGMKPYAGTEKVRGGELGGLLRIAGEWTPLPFLTVHSGLEHLAAGRVLARAGFSSGLFSFASATLRY